MSAQVFGGSSYWPSEKKIIVGIERRGKKNTGGRGQEEKKYLKVNQICNLHLFDYYKNEAK